MTTDTTWNPFDINNCSTFSVLGLSNGNLTVNYVVGPGGEGPLKSSGVRAKDGKATGKFYAELMQAGTVGVSDAITCVGVCTATAILTAGTTAATLAGDGTGGVALFADSGNIWSQGSQTISAAATLSTKGSAIGVAYDATDSAIWMRQLPSGNWNASPTADPASNKGGVSTSGISGALFPVVVMNTGTAATANCTIVANFGQNSFSGAVPTGYTSGWPAAYDPTEFMFAAD